MCFLVVYRSKVNLIIEKHNLFKFFEFFETYITFVILRKKGIPLFNYPTIYRRHPIFVFYK